MEFVLATRPVFQFERGDAETRVSTAWILFTVLVTLNALDVIFTHVGIQRGVLVENNPLMQGVVQHLWAAIAVKVASLVLVGGLLYAVRERVRIVQGALFISVAWYCFVVAWNYSLLAA